MMSQEQLHADAATLIQADSTAAHAYGAQRNLLAEQITATLSKRDDLEHLIGPDNREMMENNHRNHAEYIHSILLCYDPQDFVTTILWVYRSYQAHGFSLSYWPVQINAWLNLLQNTFDETIFEQIAPFYRWILTHQDDFAILSANNTGDA